MHANFVPESNVLLYQYAHVTLQILHELLFHTNVRYVGTVSTKSYHGMFRVMWVHYDMGRYTCPGAEGWNWAFLTIRFHVLLLLQIRWQLAHGESAALAFVLSSPSDIMYPLQVTFFPFQGHTIQLDWPISVATHLLGNIKSYTVTLHVWKKSLLTEDKFFGYEK